MNGLRSIVRAAILAVCLAAPVAAPAADGGFVAGLEDVPLMPGLLETAGAGFAFDKPSGRIAEALAEGPFEADEVRNFYAATLIQLGWVPMGDDRYRREGETLQLTIEPIGGGVRVRYTLSPDDGG